MGGLIETLRSGSWLTPERIRLYAIAALIATAGGLLFVLATAHGRNNYQGRPIGTDFAHIIQILVTVGLAMAVCWEKTVLAALWILPLVARSFPEFTGIPHTVSFLLAAFFLLLHRAAENTGIRLWVFHRVK